LMRRLGFLRREIYVQLLEDLQAAVGVAAIDGVVQTVDELLFELLLAAFNLLRQVDDLRLIGELGRQPLRLAMRLRPTFSADEALDADGNLRYAATMFLVAPVAYLAAKALGF